jgi:hypothetical protein
VKAAAIAPIGTLVVLALPKEELPSFAFGGIPGLEAAGTGLGVFLGALVVLLAIAARRPPRTSLGLREKAVCAVAGVVSGLLVPWVFLVA